MSLVIGFGLGYLVFGRGKSDVPPAPNKDVEVAALEALEVYEPKHELDERGRVVKLKLDGAHVDDVALDEAAKFATLKDLSLAGASVTDFGLAKLKVLKRLEALGLTDTRISDEGMKTLATMPSLRWVWVTENSRLTSVGIEKLKRELPGINVYVMNRPKPKVTTTTGK